MDTRSELWSKHKGPNNAYPLLAHLLDSATIAGALYDLWLRDGLRAILAEALGPKTRNLIQCIVGLHDVGKAIPLFQLRPYDTTEEWDTIRETINSSKRYLAAHSPRSSLYKYTNETARRHERWSALDIQGSLPVPKSRAEDYWLSLVLNGHHGRFTYQTDAKKSENLIRELKQTGWAAAQHDLTECVMSACKISRNDLPKKLDPTVAILLSGLVVLADRIASGESFVKSGFALLEKTSEALEKPEIWISLRSSQATERIHRTLGIYTSWESAQDAKKAILGGRALRPIQQEALEAEDGLWSVMTTTGSGKTEAALLRHSTRNERLIFLLPTQATSNAIMKRVQKAYKDTANVASLAHGLASIEEFYQQPLSIYDDEAHNSKTIDAPSGLYPSSFVRAGAARLFAPVCVGTIDQALAAALPGKWLHFRLLAMANAHVVIDEVHTLDAYQTKLLEELLPWLARTNTRVTFLTATMPSSQRELLIKAYARKELDLPKTIFPSIDSFSCDSYRSTMLATDSLKTDTELVEASFDDLISSHVKWQKHVRNSYPNARIGIICNTVKRAQAVAKQIKNNGEKTVVVLHSRMSAEHRRKATEALLSLVGPDGTGESVTVVGTQAIEASLDIDLDFLNSEICPAPSLIQRAGRLWRHSDPMRMYRCKDLTQRRLTVTLIESDKPYHHLPYLSAEIRRTANWLRRHSSFNIPGDAQSFIDSSYVSFEDAVSNEDFEALSDQTVKAIKGEANRAQLQKALDANAQASDFNSLTTANDVNEARTRLIDEGRQYRLILGSQNPSSLPGAWRYGSDELIAILSRDQDSVREAMRASMPIALSAPHAKYLHDQGMVSLENARSLLAGYHFLPRAERFYDPLNGFVIPEHSDGEPS